MREFDVVTLLQLHLSGNCSRGAVLTLLTAWLYTAEQQELAERQPSYVRTLRLALNVMSQAADVEQGLQTLREGQPFLRLSRR